MATNNLPPHPWPQRPTWVRKLLTALSTVAEASEISHAGKLKSSRYFVWEEDRADDLCADNRHAERAMRGYLDLYTEREFDPWVEEIGEAFDGAGILWDMTGTTWEENTGLFHHSWEWTVV